MRLSASIPELYRKDNENSFWFQSNTMIYYYFEPDDMFRPIDHHQAIYTGLRISCI